MNELDLTHQISAQFYVQYEYEIKSKWWQFWKSPIPVCGMRWEPVKAMITTYEADIFISNEKALRARLVSMGNVGINNIRCSQVEIIVNKTNYIQTELTNETTL